MSDDDQAAGVVDDFRHALEDLTGNLRVEIVTLTNIAKESYSHAHAIAGVIRDHIKKAPAIKTLPALYVLDSIVKNIGTPYTTYFSKDLYTIFMGAYAKVDGHTRRKMDEMLKTWKEPVPGSLDRRPVFSPDVTRAIEQALVSARDAARAAQQNITQETQQLLGRGRPNAPPMRDTPTPPNRPGSRQAVPYGQPPLPPPTSRQPQEPASIPRQGYVSGPLTMHQVGSQPPPAGTYPPHPAIGLPSQQQQPPRPQEQPYGAPQGGLDIEQLKGDIQRLIDVERAESAMGPLDTSKQKKLQALMDLQMIVQRPGVPQDQLMLIKNNVAELSVNMRLHNNAFPLPPTTTASHSSYVPPPSTYTPTPPAMGVSHPPAAPVAPVLTAPPAAATAAPALSFDSLFGQGALAAVARAAAAQKAGPVSMPMPVVSTPPQSALATLPAIKSPPPVPAPAPGLIANPSALLAMLKQRGLVSAGAPAGQKSAPVSPAASLASLASLPSLAGLLPSVRPATVPEDPNTNMALRPASLKQYRPEMISKLYHDLGPQCTQCGRRFKTDEEGRKKKTAHMDWHFRVNQRIAEAEKRGQHRSWYVGAEDWIKSREVTGEDPFTSQQQPSDGGTPGGSSGPAGRTAPKMQYILAPDPADTRTNRVCPICREEFDSEYMKDEGVDDFVWLDAVRVGGRVLHASCLAATAKDRVGTPPEPVLGKRKAEDYDQPARNRTQMRGY